MGAGEGHIRSVLDQVAARPDTGPVSFALARPADDWSFSYGNESYFIGAITKLFTVTIAQQLREAGQLDLDAPITEHLGRDQIAGLHVHRLQDRSETITARQLMSHTTGLPDFFTDTRRGGGTTSGDALTRDRGFTFDEALRTVREGMTPRYAPGAGRRAHYSDTDYVLLGRIIEEITGRPWEHVVRTRIIGPLGLANTWPFTLNEIDRYDSIAPILSGTTAVRIPLTMASVRAQGGIVSTAADGIRFLTALLGGELFDGSYLPEMTTRWRRLRGSLHYGLGLMRFTTPRGAVRRGAPSEFIGHASGTGAMLFTAPENGLTVSGTLNTICNPAKLHRTLLALAIAAAER